MSHVLRLMYPVSRDREPDETDIVSLKQSLERIGQYEAPNWQKATDYDGGLFDAVEDFQQSKGLKIDGVVKPRGPTAEAIAAELGPASPLVMEKDPRPVPGIRDPYRFPLDIDANARAANQRTVKALRHAGKYGLLPGLAATAWQKGDSGKAQVVDLFHQVGADDARAGTGHARNLEDRFLPMIPRDDRGLFRGLLGRKRESSSNKVVQAAGSSANNSGPVLPYPMVPPIGDSRTPPKVRKDKFGSGDFGSNRDGGTRHHNGVDLEAAPGTPVRSPVDGVVERFGDPYGDRQYGIIWIRSANGVLIGLFYTAPLDAAGNQIVRPGDRVSAGQTVGKLQDIAKRYTKPNKKMDNHLHLEVRRGPGHGRPIDPTPWLRNWGAMP